MGHKYTVLTKSGINISNSLVHGHVYQASPQAEVREHQQAFLQPLIEHQQRLVNHTHIYTQFMFHECRIDEKMNTITRQNFVYSCERNSFVAKAQYCFIWCDVSYTYAQIGHPNMMSCQSCLSHIKPLYILITHLILDLAVLSYHILIAEIWKRKRLCDGEKLNLSFLETELLLDQGNQHHIPIATIIPIIFCHQ